MQVRVLNHPEVLLSKVAVLSVREKAGLTGQIRVMEMNESEPSMTLRNAQILPKARR